MLSGNNYNIANTDSNTSSLNLKLEKRQLEMEEVI